MTSPHGTVRIVQFGLGPVGCAIAREVLRRPGLELVGAVDLDPAKVGRDLGEVLGAGERLGVALRSEGAAVIDEEKPDLVLLTTTSSLEKLTPSLLEVIQRGAHVVSTCEELSFPWQTQAALAAQIDTAAREAGVAVLSTGVNPGFVMDFLPSVVSALCREVRSVHVERFLDAGARREVFQRKVGAGLDLEAFGRAAAAGTLRHVGLEESVHMIGQALGWRLEVEESLEPVVAADQRTARGVEQIARGRDASGEVLVTLHFRATVGEASPHDRIRVEATPPLDLTLAGGVHGDLATCNVVANAIPAVLRSAPGLRTMLDLLPATGSSL